MAPRARSSETGHSVVLIKGEVIFLPDRSSCIVTLYPSDAGSPVQDREGLRVVMNVPTGLLIWKEEASDLPIRISELPPRSRRFEGSVNSCCERVCCISLRWLSFSDSSPLNSPC